jgi:hypothetical protein
MVARWLCVKGVCIKSDGWGMMVELFSLRLIITFVLFDLGYFLFFSLLLYCPFVLWLTLLYNIYCNPFLRYRLRLSNMRFSDLLASLAILSATVPETLAHPGSVWKERLAEIQARAARPVDGPDDSSELLGDLVTLGPNTKVGKLVADLLVGKQDAQSSEINQKAAGSLGSAACQKDTCCVWTYLAAEMAQTFRTSSGRCNKFARGAVRLAFHDSGPWKKGLDHGGADGSLLLSNEMSRPVNKGLEEIASVTNGWYVFRSSNIPAIHAD